MLHAQKEQSFIKAMDERIQHVERIIVNNGWKEPLQRIEVKLDETISKMDRRIDVLEEWSSSHKRMFALDQWGQAERDALIPMCQWWAQRGRRMPFLTSWATLISLSIGIVVTLSILGYNLLFTPHSSTPLPSLPTPASHP